MLIIYFLSIILLVSIPWVGKVAVQFSNMEFYPQVQFPWFTCTVLPSCPEVHDRIVLFVCLQWWSKRKICPVRC